jgi:hypothetical protein
MLEAQPISLSRDFALALDICLFARACGINPDPVQQQLLTTQSNRVLVNCCRQWGKSSLTSIISLHAAIYSAPAMIVIVSPSMQQSTEVYKKCHDYWQKIPGAPRANQESLTRLQLENGSRIISLPGSEKTVRGYSGATVVVVDEASRVPDEMLAAVRPMLATTSGRFFALSTPNGNAGWWYEAWARGEGGSASPSGAASARAYLSNSSLMNSRRSGRCGTHKSTTASSLTRRPFSTELIEQALTDEFEPFLD